MAKYTFYAYTLFMELFVMQILEVFNFSLFSNDHIEMQNPLLNS